MALDSAQAPGAKRLLRLRGVGVTVCGSVPLVLDGRTRGRTLFSPLMRRGVAETEFGVRIILSNEARGAPSGSSAPAYSPDRDGAVTRGYALPGRGDRNPYRPPYSSRFRLLASHSIGLIRVDRGPSRPTAPSETNASPQAPRRRAS